MTTTYWSPNSITTAQVDTVTITAVAVGGTLTFTINGKSLTYTCITGDTTSTAATALQALLSASTIPPEFTEITFTVASAVITCTAATPGTPFTMTTSSGGGATLSQVHTTANASPSDVGLAANWNRGGSAALPQATDDVIIANSAVPLLWNLTALAAIRFGTFRRWQTFTGTIGLPENNPLGYIEYRPTYFQFKGPNGGNLVMTLGEMTGSGPSRERYDLQDQQYTCTVLASGSAADNYAVRIKGSSSSSIVNVLNTSVGVAMLPGETASLASAVVDGGGTLALGSGVTIAGAVTGYGSTIFLGCAPGSVACYNSTRLTVGSTGLTYASILADNGSSVSYISNSTVTTLTLSRGSTFDRSGDVRAMTITNSTIDADCQVNDPNNTITYANATSVNGQVSSGPFVFTGTRTVKIT